MAKKKVAKKKTRSKSSESISTPKFPYTTVPNSLRRFLELVPTKPKPTKITGETLKSWGLRNSNDATILRVIKNVGLLTSTGEPTDQYKQFMMPESGPGILAQGIKNCWAPIFENSHEPHRESDDTLKNYFNVHSGGSDRAIQYQISTFKAICDYADFGASIAPVNSSSTQNSGATGLNNPPGQDNSPQFHIDLHIHLPENKSRRDYEYIFEDIARYIFGRDVSGNNDD